MRSMRMFVTLASGVLVLAMGSTVLAGAPPGWPAGKQAPEPDPVLGPGDVNGGQAGFTLGKEVVKLPIASGTITKVEGIYLVDLSFRDAKTTTENVAAGEGKLLRIGLGTNGPGPALITNMFAAKSGRALLDCALAK